MKFKIIIILLLISFQVKSQCEELIWFDEFNDTILNEDNWTIEVNDDGGGNNELQYYTDRQENVKVENGNLIITAKAESYQGKNYTSGRINSQYKADFRYGRFEARIKFPFGRGMWPAFWLLSTDNTFGSWPYSGEIDIVELLGHQPQVIYGTIHFGPPAASSGNSYILSGGTFADTFHTFSIVWSPDTMQWFVDSILYSTKTSSEIPAWDIFKERFHIILNLAVGGNWPGNPDATTQFPQKMEVDYVRIYSNPDNILIKGKSKVTANESGVEYSVPFIAGASYNWIVPSGSIISSGINTHAITVDFACTPGDVEVNITTGCGISNLKTAVSFKPLEISGSSEVFETDTVKFSVPEISGATYLWAVSLGVTIVSGQGSSTIFAQWSCTSGIATVDVTGSCISASDSFKVDLACLPIIGPETISSLTNSTSYSTTSIPGLAYNWTTSSNGTIINGQGTSEIEIDWNSSAVPFFVNLSISAGGCTPRIFTRDVLFTESIYYATYDGSFLNFLPFGGSTFEIINDPTGQSLNDCNDVAMTYKGPESFAGIYADLPGELDFSVNKFFYMRVYPKIAGSVILKLEDVSGGQTSIEKNVFVTNTDQWNDLAFNFSNAGSGIYDRITLFFAFGATIQDTFYFDDIILGNTISSIGESIHLETVLEVIPNPAEGIINISINQFRPNFIVSVLDINGKIWITDNLIGRNVQMDIESLPSGIYFVRVSNGAGINLMKKIIKY